MILKSDNKYRILISSDLTMEAQRIGVQLTIVAAMDPGVAEMGQSFIAGNMPPQRLLSLVGEMGPDKELDVCPVKMPKMPLPFDQLCSDRAALRQVNIRQ